MDDKSISKSNQDTINYWDFTFGSLSNKTPYSLFHYYQSEDVNNLYRIILLPNNYNARFAKGLWEQSLLSDTLIYSG